MYRLDPTSPAESSRSCVSWSRRQVVTALAGMPIAGSIAQCARCEGGEERRLTGDLDLAGELKKLKAPVPQGQIGKLKLSRLILGGNLIGGWAHARDLIYAPEFVKAYHHRRKVFETLQLAEACGVNTFLTNPILCPLIQDYWRSTGGKIQFISDCGGDLFESIPKSIDSGAAACYIFGGTGDRWAAEGKFDLIAKGLELIRSNGLPAGIGGHKLRTIKACVEKGLKPDFWMKTLHHGNYWSAKAETANDNTWCDEPEQLIDLMKHVEQPWIGFKTLAAGAIHPRDGFRYAFQNGADFICVGMFDFQIVEDANLTVELLKGKLPRQRNWLGGAI